MDTNIPEQNVKAGELHLQRMLDLYDGNPILATAAYNGGEGTIGKALELAGSSNWPDVIEALRYAVTTGKLSASKYKEIVEYPTKVMSAYSAIVGVTNG